MSPRPAGAAVRAPVGGVVLAAGRSSRMGEPKALLETEGESFFERAARILAEGGCDPVVAVVPPGEIGERLVDRARRSGTRAVVNEDPQAEQVDSLRLGLDTLPPDVVAAVVLPVDHPRVLATTVASLLEAFRIDGAPIVRPVHRGRPGHPVVFARDVWAELEAPDLQRGARDVVHHHRGEIEEVPVDDPGIAIDVNTPEEYEREVNAT